MKQNWKLSKLGQISKVIAGQSPQGKYYNNLGQGLPFYQGKKEFTEKFIGSPKTWTTHVTKEAMDGDILMSVRAPVGPVNFSNQKICIGRGLAAIRVSENLNKDYLFYYLINIQNKLSGTSGAVFNSINKTQIENIEIPTPPLPEQQRIVDILDQSFASIDQAIENTKKNIDNIKIVFNNYLFSLFSKKNHGWVEQKLSEIALVKGGKRVPKGYKLKITPTNYPYIRVTDFNDYGSINLDDIHYIDDHIYEQIKRYTISTNDLYISIAGTIGKSGIIPKELEGANLTENACKLEFKIPINPKFIYYFTKSNYFMEQAGLNTRVAAMPKLALSRLGTIKLSIPMDLAEQNKYVKILDEISMNIQELQIYYNQKIEKLQELKHSILHQAFNGEL